ncbi:MAG: DUF2802 domain-containing protein [Ectothiorhodospiraceae bacterium]|nr:DUF2802 domain-containing protein [Ectothiorhodospiraceae bacterium]
MMNIPFNAFSMVAVTALGFALVTLLIGYKHNKQLRIKLDQQQNSLQTLAADVSAMCSGAVNLGEHLAHLEQRWQHLGRRQDQLEMSNTGPQNFRHAKKMMHKGAELEEVMADCGIARGEAELVALAGRIKKAS